MPRTPVDGKKVVEHRITLGGKERQLLDEMTMAYQIKNIGGTIVSAISTPAVGTLLIGAIVLILDRYLDPDWREITKEMSPDALKDWLETQNLIGMGIGGIIGGILAGPIGLLFGVGVGGVAVEGGEELVSEFQDQVIDKTEPSTIIFIALQIVQLKDRIDGLNPFN